MSSGRQEPDSSQLHTELSENMTSRQLTLYLVNLEARVSAMEETLDSSWENMSEKTQMSFRNRRALALRPINSLKHVVDTSGAVTGSTPATVDLTTQVDAPVTTQTNQVHIGSAVKAIFLSVQVVGTTAYGGVPRIYFVVFKNPGNQVPIPAVDGIGISPRRKFVIHQEMLMVTTQSSTNDGFPRTMFKGVILLPKRYQRHGDADKLQFVIGNASAEATGSSDWCLQCIYKEFF